jgi:NAD(P)H-dependent FMN reductase
MGNRILVFYGSYRSDRMGIRLAQFAVDRLRRRDEESGARAATAWHGTISEMGMVVVSSTIAAGPIGQSLSTEGQPVGEGARRSSARSRAFPRLADDLMWWVEAAKAQRQRKAPPC